MQATWTWPPTSPASPNTSAATAVKDAHLHKAKAREAELLKEWDNPLRVVQAV